MGWESFNRGIASSRTLERWMRGRKSSNDNGTSKHLPDLQRLTALNRSSPQHRPNGLERTTSCPDSDCRKSIRCVDARQSAERSSDSRRNR
jgi:hypothetical protein